MDAEAILKETSKPVSKKQAVFLAEKCADSISALIDLCLHRSQEIAFRSAWIAEIVALNYPVQFAQHFDEFIKAYSLLKNRSGQRHFTKILMELTSKKRNDLCGISRESEQIIETTFEWMIDPLTPVAVRVNCMDILFNLRDRSDWIADELRAQIEFQLQNGSAALQSRGKRLLHKLSRIR